MKVRIRSSFEFPICLIWRYKISVVRLLFNSITEIDQADSTMLALAREFMGQRREELFLGDLTVRQQKAKALDYCASQFLTEGRCTG